ncbi:MAG: hypothetical protein QOH25_2516 [Acidobacteriota bacterium]|jgi:hypothetical protein|nr:hypothetical protein [Acidobacteriota bacterium]
MMKIKSQWALVAAVVVVLLCLVGWGGRAQSATRATWEYKVITMYGTIDTPAPNLTQFNQMGDEGWELVTTRSEDFNRGSNQRRAEYFFKRAK